MTRRFPRPSFWPKQRKPPNSSLFLALDHLATVTAPAYTDAVASFLGAATLAGG
jgi:hypothetical protein